jgi:2-phosphosulfolactate phosphatase
MILDVDFGGGGRERRAASGRAAVVIDILRASTTITVALHHGSAGVVPVRTVGHARAAARALGDGVLLGGERRAARVTGFDLGNSPGEYTRERVQGRVVVLTTTNGTRALHNARPASAVIACAFVNVSAAARWVARCGLDVIVMCAGRKGGFAIEDAVGAGMLVDRLLSGTGGPAAVSDAAGAARLLYAAHRGDLLAMLHGSEWGRDIARQGFGDDLELCARVDLTDVVPVMRDGRLVPERA